LKPNSVGCEAPNILPVQISIRKASVKDALGIAIVQAYTWQTSYTGLLPEAILQDKIEHIRTKEQLLKKNIETNGNFLVALIEETVVGFACYGASRNEQYENDGEIAALYVLKGFQRLGIGKKLLTACTEEFRKNGLSHFILNCLRGNLSLGFYTEMGGSPVGSRQDTLFGTPVTEDILRFAL